MANQTNAPAATVESLQAELQAEQAAHLTTKKTSEGAYESLRAEFQAEQSAHGATKDALATATAQTDEAGSALAQATGIIAGQKALIDEQEAQIVSLQVAPAQFPAFKQGGATYEVEVKHFKYKGADYTVVDLLKDKNLQKELVGKGVGFLIKKEA